MRVTFDEWALRLARSYAERGTCSRRKTGAVGVDEFGRIIGMGLNGVPRGIVHCTDKPCPGAGGPPGDTSRCWAIHCEENMVLHSSDPFRITTVYSTNTPCFKCSLLLANLPKLTRVVYLEDYSDMGGLEVLKQRGIKVEKHRSQEGS